MKQLKISLVIVCAVLSLSACSKYKTYQEACNDGQFEVAYAMTEKIDDLWRKHDAEAYIFRREVEVLSEKLNRESVEAIRNLFERRTSFGLGSAKDNVRESLIRKAALKGDIELCELAMSLPSSKSYFSKDVYNIILDMYREGDIQKFRNFVKANLKEEAVLEYVIGYISESGDAELLNRIVVQQPEAIFANSELLELLAKHDGEKLARLIKKKIANMKVNVELPQIGLVKSIHFEEFSKPYDKYISAVTKYNNKCIELLASVIELGDSNLADFIVGSMMKNLTYTELGSWGSIVEKDKDAPDYYKAFKVELNDNDIKRAKQMVVDYL